MNAEIYVAGNKKFAFKWDCEGQNLFLRRKDLSKIIRDVTYACI